MESTNRREFVRARVSYPAKVRVLDQEEKGLVEKGLGVTLFRGGDSPEPLEEFATILSPGTETEILYKAFKSLNSKLDFIIEQLTFPLQDQEGPFKEVIELSGSGLKFKSSAPIPEGAYLKIDLIIPSSLQFKIEMIAQCIRVDEEGDVNRYLIAVKFIDIDERARDAIIENVFKRQRKVIRKQKERKDEQGPAN